MAATLVDSMPRRHDFVYSHFTSPATRPRRQTAASSTSAGTILPNIHPAGNVVDDELSLSALAKPPTNVSFACLDDDTSATSSNQAVDTNKLRKKHARKALHRRGQSLETTSTESLSNVSYTPLDSNDSDRQSAHSRVTSRSASTDKLMKKLGKIARDSKEKSESGVIDTSLSLEENEKRSGIAISSATQSPEVTHVSNFQHRHSRSFSNGSIYSTGPKVSLPVSPRRTSFATLNSEPSIKVEGVGLGFDTLHHAKPDGFIGASSQNTAVNNESETPIKVLASSKAMPSSIVNNRERAHTYDGFTDLDDIAPGTTTATAAASRQSGERAFGFKRARTSSNKDVHMDKDTRQAMIASARREFKEREEAKERKFEEQERRAQEKRDRKLQRQQKKQRSKSESAAPLYDHLSNPERASNWNVDSDVSDVAPTFHKLPSKSTWSNGDSECEAQQKLGKHIRKQSGKRNSSGLFSWCKVHLLHL